MASEERPIGMPSGGSGRGGGSGASVGASFRVDTKSLEAMHKAWRQIVTDIRDVNKELKNLSQGKTHIDAMTRAAAQFHRTMGGGSSARFASGSGGTTDLGGSHPGAGPKMANTQSPDFGSVNTGGGGGGGGGAGDTRPFPAGGGGGGSPRNFGQYATQYARNHPYQAAAVGATAAAGSVLQRNLPDILAAQQYALYQQRASATPTTATSALNFVFGGRGQPGIGGFASTQEAVGGLNTLTQRRGTGLTTTPQGQAQLQAAGRAGTLLQDFGAGSNIAAAGGSPSTYNSLRLIGINSRPGGQPLPPEQLARQVLTKIYRGRMPTVEEINAGSGEGGRLNYSLHNLGLDEDTINYILNYGLAQARAGGRLTTQDLTPNKKHQLPNTPANRAAGIAGQSSLTDSQRAKGASQAGAVQALGEASAGALTTSNNVLASVYNATAKALQVRIVGDVAGGVATAGLLAHGPLSALGHFANSIPGANLLFGNPGGSPGGSPGDPGGSPGSGGGGGLLGTAGTLWALWKATRLIRGGARGGAGLFNGVRSAASGVGDFFKRGAGDVGDVIGSHGWTTDGAGNLVPKAASTLGRVGELAGPVGAIAGGAVDAVSAVRKAVSGDPVSGAKTAVSNVFFGDLLKKLLPKEGPKTGDHSGVLDNLRKNISTVLPLGNALGLGGGKNDATVQGANPAAGSNAGGSPNNKLKVFYPVPGAIVTQHFGAKNGRDAGGHPGTDFAAPLGTPIVACEDGKVLLAGPASGFGNWIVIQHPDGYYTVYGHMFNDGVLVHSGQQVKGGSQIGKVGSNGVSTGAHCHLEVHNGWPGQRLDPEAWLRGHNAANAPAGGGGADTTNTDKQSNTSAPTQLGGGLSNYGSQEEVTVLGGMFGRGAPASGTQSSSSSSASSTSSGDPNASVPGGATTSSANVEIGRKLAASMFNWTGNEFDALNKLWTGESNWDATIPNQQGSGAYGIPQALPASKMASAGADWRTNPATQIKWGLGYIHDVYRDPINAYRIWLSRSPHSYRFGTTYAEDGGRTHEGEIVIPAEPSARFRAWQSDSRSRGGAGQSTTTSRPNQQFHAPLLHIELSMPVSTTQSLDAAAARRFAGYLTDELENSDRIKKISMDVAGRIGVKR